MRKRLLSAVRAGSSWGSYGVPSAPMSDAQAYEIIDAVLLALTEPDEAMQAAGDPAAFKAMIEVVRRQQPKAAIIGEAIVVVGDYSSAGPGTKPVIGDYTVKP